jgi:predicted RNA-binding Zn ribbon-like protein
VDLTSYAELAVRLVNSSFSSGDHPDPLGTVDAFGALVADRPHLSGPHRSGPTTLTDLAALRALRAELADIFVAAATGRDEDAVARLNALLARSSIQPELVRHDDLPWHLHLADSGSVADRFAAGATIGLSLMASQLGLSRLGVCSIASCQRVFIDASPNRSRRYCTEHSTNRTNVTTIRVRSGPPGPRQADTAVS